MDIKSPYSAAYSKKTNQGKNIFDSMVSEFASNAYTSKNLNLELNVN